MSDISKSQKSVPRGNRRADSPSADKKGAGSKGSSNASTDTLDKPSVSSVTPTNLSVWPD
jgi:hypothetical protein